MYILALIDTAILMMSKYLLAINFTLKLKFYLSLYWYNMGIDYKLRKDLDYVRR